MITRMECGQKLEDHVEDNAHGWHMRESVFCEDLPGGPHQHDRLGRDVRDSLSKPVQQRQLSVALVPFPEEKRV